jgi:hypothetical protein
MYSTAKRILVGKPIPSADEHLSGSGSSSPSRSSPRTPSPPRPDRREILVVLLIQAQIGKEAWKYLC